MDLHKTTYNQQHIKKHYITKSYIKQVLTI